MHELTFVRAECDEAAVRDFLNLDALNLSRRAAIWAQEDRRYGQVAPYIYGARVLRQHPVECLFEFICSSNNHISRIGSMVEHLCTAYGTQLTVHKGEPHLPSKFLKGPWLMHAPYCFSSDARCCALIRRCTSKAFQLVLTPSLRLCL